MAGISPPSGSLLTLNSGSSSLKFALFDALDPLHMPHNVAPIHAVAAARPGLPQVACFDTAFHHTLPREARWFGLPRALEAEGIRRYGFHGLSYEFIAGRLAEDAPALARGRVVVAHLGSGASLCALKEGRSIATTMGFSTLDGLLMATRCGSLDPGVILYLGRQGRSLGEIEDMLYHRSGLAAAGNAIEALKAKLAITARVKRDGKWSAQSAKDLVPGDVNRLRLGDIVPADARLLDGDEVSLDQAALTGESLPVTKTSGDAVFSGSIVRRGETGALVYATGDNSRTW